MSPAQIPPRFMFQHHTRALEGPLRCHSHPFNGPACFFLFRFAGRRPRKTKQVAKYSGWWLREGQGGAVRLKLDARWCYIYTAEELWVSGRSEMSHESPLSKRSKKSKAQNPSLCLWLHCHFGASFAPQARESPRRRRLRKSHEAMSRTLHFISRYPGMF